LALGMRVRAYLDACEVTSARRNRWVEIQMRRL
jgi:hypothetical protein